MSLNLIALLFLGSCFMGQQMHAIETLSLKSIPELQKLARSRHEAVIQANNNHSREIANNVKRKQREHAFKPDPKRMKALVDAKGVAAREYAAAKEALDEALRSSPDFDL